MLSFYTVWKANLHLIYIILVFLKTVKCSYYKLVTIFFNVAKQNEKVEMNKCCSNHCTSMCGIIHSYDSDSNVLFRPEMS